VSTEKLYLSYSPTEQDAFHYSEL